MIKYINRLTDLFIKLSLPNVKAKYKRRGIKWTKRIEQNQILRFKSTLPVMYWYGVMWLCAAMLPEHIVRTVPSEIPVGMFFLLAIWGFNNYFGWVKIKGTR